MASAQTSPTLGNDEAANGSQTISYEGVEYTAIREGLATILVAKNTSSHSADPKAKKQKTEALEQSVFYNPIQQFNRDLSVLAVRVFGEDYLTRVRLGKGRRKGKRQRDEDMSEGSRKRPCVNGAAEGNRDVSENIGGQRVSQGSQTTVQSHPNPNEGESISADYDVEAAQTKYQFKVLDALSATGLRALRYAHELPFATLVNANDLSRQATDSIRLNVEYNKLEDKIRTTTSNANAHMYSVLNEDESNKKTSKYQIIDLDPYGTVAPFLDAALQALVNDGLLCITSTDTAIFASNSYPEKAYSQYGGLPVKGYHSHEVGLRLLLHATASAAARYGLAIEPLLSLSIDFYARIFIRVRKSAADVKYLAGKTMIAYCCDAGCGSWKTQYLARFSPVEAKDGTVWHKHTMAQAPTSSTHCEHCGFKMHIAGPMYGGPIHNPAFIQRILDCISELDSNTYNTLERLEGMLQTALEEIPPDSHIIRRPTDTDEDISGNNLIPRLDPTAIDHHPFFFHPSLLAKVLHAQSPPDAAIKGALRHAGYFATRSHAKPASVKTNAPWTFIWHMMREWIRQRASVRDGLLKEGMAGWKIASKTAAKASTKEEEGELEDTTGASISAVQINHAELNKGSSKDFKATWPKVVFDEKLGKRDPSKKKLRRYQMNPRPNWGPMAKAKN